MQGATKQCTRHIEHIRHQYNNSYKSTGIANLQKVCQRDWHVSTHAKRTSVSL